jgi:hypothetical protein
MSYFREKFWFFVLAAVALSAALGGITYGQGYLLPSGATVQSHFYTNAEGTPPTCTNCTIATGSSDFAGAATVTTTGGVVLTFGTAFTNTPFCVASDNTTNEGIKGAPSTTGVTFTGGVTSDVLAWVCVGR